MNAERRIEACWRRCGRIVQKLVPLLFSIDCLKALQEIGHAGVFGLTRSLCMGCVINWPAATRDSNAEHSRNSG